MRKHSLKAVTFALIFVCAPLFSEAARTYLDPFDYYVPDFPEVERAFSLISVVSRPNHTREGIEKLLD